MGLFVYAQRSRDRNMMCFENMLLIAVADVQASTNTVLAHFASIVFANWLLRILNKSVDKQKAAAAY